MARAHNDANVIALGARVVGTGVAEHALADVPRAPRSRAAATSAGSSSSTALDAAKSS